MTIQTRIRLRQPVADDGHAIFGLVKNSPPLDLNSAYLYLLQATHFASTCVLAERDGKVVGWLSGYIRPDDSATYFLWQVAIDQSARGQGLAGHMLQAVLQRPACTGVHYLEASITPDNAASWQLFRSFAQKRQTTLEESLMFSERQLGGAHAPEMLVRIGPFY